MATVLTFYVIPKLLFDTIIMKNIKNDQKNQLHFIEHFYVMTHAKIIQTTSFGVSKSSPFVLQCLVVCRYLLI